MPDTDTLNQLRESEAQFYAIAEAMPQMVFRTNPDGNVDFFNSAWYAFTGLPEGAGNLDGWQAALHPDDVDRVARIWDQAHRTGAACEDEYRLRHHSGEYRWVLTRAQPVKLDDGTVVRWLGTSTDIHTVKMAEEHSRLMLGEMSHRVKNTMALLQAVVSQSLRQTETLEDAQTAIGARIAAMSRAHDHLVDF